MRISGLELPVREEVSESPKASDGEASSGDEVLGDERSEVRMDVADWRITNCFLKMPTSGVDIMKLGETIMKLQDYKMVGQDRPDVGKVIAGGNT